MGNWSKQKEIQLETKAREKVRKEKMAGYFLDLSKLIFVAMVLAGSVSLIQGGTNLPQIMLLVFGIIGTILFLIFGYKLLK